jgi:hypothetical protein
MELLQLGTEESRVASLSDQFSTLVETLWGSTTKCLFEGRPLKGFRYYSLTLFRARIHSHKWNSRNLDFLDFQLRRNSQIILPSWLLTEIIWQTIIENVLMRKELKGTGV